MSRNNEHDDVLEWTLAEAPPPDETPPEDWAAPLEVGSPSAAAHEAHHARRFSRWTWLTLGGLILLSISVIAGYNAWNQWHAESALRQVVLEEETAALAGDANALQGLIAPGYADWMEAQLALAERGQAAPVPLPWLKPPAQRGVIAAIKQFGSDIMLVTVRREFITPAGTPVAFTLPQFYQYQEGWKRVPPPPGYDGEQKELDGARLTVVYAASDADLVTSIFPALDDMLQRACAEWACAEDFAVTMSFLGDTPAPEVMSGASERVVSAGGRFVNEGLLPQVVTDALTGPRLFAVLAPFNTSWLDQEQLMLPAPHRAGAPADAAGVAEYQQMAAQTLLAYTAQQLYRHAHNIYSSERNAFVFALAARLSVRLGLEAPEALNITAFNAPTSAMEALWNAGASGVWNEPTQRQETLRSALILVDALLESEPAETERRLFQQLPQRGSLMEWATEDLGLSVTELFHRFRAASEKNHRVEVQFEERAFMALNCQGQPMLWERGENVARPFLSGVFPFAGMMAGTPSTTPWSPDGRRLALFASGLAVVDMQTNTLTWVPEMENRIAVMPVAWLSNTLLAYLAYSGFTDTEMHIEVQLFDFADPERQFPAWPQLFTQSVFGYTLSPQRDWAAVTGVDDNGGGNNQITIMPALGGEPVAVFTGTSPVWSPYGGSLMYVHYETGEGFTLKRVDLRPQPLMYVVVAGDTLWGIAEHFNVRLTELVNLNHLSSDVIQVGQTLAIPVADQPEAPTTEREVLSSSELLLSNTSTNATVAWSPNGSALALAVTSGQTQSHASVWLIDPNGNNRRRLIEEPTGSIFNLAFSADGKYLAINYYNGQAQQFKVYSTITSEPVFTMPTTEGFAWSSTGHQLAVRSGDTIQVLDSPVAGFMTETLKAEACTDMWWRPGK